MLICELSEGISIIAVVSLIVFVIAKIGTWVSNVNTQLDRLERRSNYFQDTLSGVYARLVNLEKRL